MAYITPSSKIQVYKNIKLRKNSEDTLLFTSRSAQETYFGTVQSSNILFSDTKFTYINNNDRMTVRIPSPMSTVFNANYMRFQNTSYENKWIYCFVDKVIHINDGCTELEFTIDPLQTWLPNVDYTLNECLIKREHQTSSDNVGDNTEPEPIQVSAYHPKGYSYDGTRFSYVQEYDIFGGGYWIAVRLPHHTGASSSLMYAYSLGAGLGSIVWDSGMLFPVSQIFDNVPCGDLIAIFDGGSSSDLSDLEQLTRGAGSKILGMWVIPKAILPASSSYISTSWTIRNSLNTFSVNPKVLFNATVEGVVDDCPVTVDGPIVASDVTLSYSSELTTLPVLPGHTASYMVKNKKTFTNPFCMYEITAPNGQKIALSFEDLHANQYDNNKQDNHVYLKIIGSILDTQISAIPLGDNRLRYGYDKQLGLPKPPIGSFSGQTDKSSLISMISGVVELAGSAGALALGGPAGTVLSGFASSAGIATSKVTDRCDSSGIYNLSNLGLWGQSMRAFSGAFMYAENFKAIDEYFDAYGYTQNKVETPSLSHRTYWTYVQTSGANFTAVSIPAEGLNAICELFDRGIRFHKNDYTIGNLSNYTNAITT